MTYEASICKYWIIIKPNSMRTGEEIAENITDTIRHLFFSSFDSDDYKYVNNVIGSELNTYAKEVAIAFQYWIVENWKDGFMKMKTEEIFNQFIQSIKP